MKAKTLGKMVRNARRNKWRTQKQVLKLFEEKGYKICLSYLAMIEIDKAMPTTQLIFKLADVLDLDAEVLFKFKYDAAIEKKSRDLEEEFAIQKSISKLN